MQHRDITVPRCQTDHSIYGKAGQTMLDNSDFEYFDALSLCYNCLVHPISMKAPRTHDIGCMTSTALAVGRGPDRFIISLSVPQPHNITQATNIMFTQR